MAAGKEIRGKIKSVENTKKITKAMEMVAASKMRKAQERMRAARPYSDKIRNIAANLSQANPEYTHAFMQTNDSKVTGFIVVTTINPVVLASLDCMNAWVYSGLAFDRLAVMLRILSL